MVGRGRRAGRAGLSGDRVGAGAGASMVAWAAGDGGAVAAGPAGATAGGRRRTSRASRPAPRPKRSPPSAVTRTPRLKARAVALGLKTKAPPRPNRRRPPRPPHAGSAIFRLDRDQVPQAPGPKKSLSPFPRSPARPLLAKAPWVGWKKEKRSMPARARLSPPSHRFHRRTKRPGRRQATQSTPARARGATATGGPRAFQKGSRSAAGPARTTPPQATRATRSRTGSFQPPPRRRPFRRLLTPLPPQPLALSAWRMASSTCRTPG